MPAPPPSSTISPARLFRLLCGGPRPRLPLSTRLAVAPRTPLFVVGLRGVEEQEAVDAAEGIVPPVARVDRIIAEILVRCLWTPDGPAFSSADDLGLLGQTEGEKLHREVSRAFLMVSPTYPRQSADDAARWSDVLEQGARDPSNLHEMVTLGGAIEYGYRRLTPRPDLYWGIPLCQLTDGQLMVYRAARRVYSRMIEQHG